MDEYEKFIAENGTVSVHGKYIIYCDKVNYSTGTAEIKEINKYTIVETVEPYPDGCAENVVYT